MLLHPKPFRDESLGGYILRTAQLNKQSSKLIYNLAGLMIGDYPGMNLNPYLIEPESHDLRALSTLTKVDFSILKLMPFPDKCDNFNSVQSMVEELGVHIRKSKICPECLKERNYIRKMWDFIVVTVCPHHQCLLIDRCPQCSTIISYLRPETHRCSCGFDFRTMTSNTVPKEQAVVSRFIARELFDIRYTDMETENLECPLFDKAADIVIKIFLLLGRYRDGTYIGTRLTNAKLRNSDLHATFTSIFEMFSHWPDNFWVYLRRFQEHRNVIGTKQFGRLYEVLYREQFDNNEFDFLRAAFEEYLTSHWDHGNAGLITKLIEESLVRKYVTGSTARSVLGIHQKYIKRLIQVGQLGGIVKNAEGRRKKLILVDHESLKLYATRLRDALSLEDTARILGISRRTIMNHQFYTLLRPLRGPTVDGTAYWYFDRQSVFSVIEKISKCIRLDFAGTKNNKHLVGFKTAYKIASRYKPCCLREFINDIGRILFPCGTTSDGGLRQFVFDKREILAVYKNDVTTV